MVAEREEFCHILLLVVKSVLELGKYEPKLVAEREEFCHILLLVVKSVLELGKCEPKLVAERERNSAIFCCWLSSLSWS